MAPGYRTYVYPTPTKGYAWQVSKDGKILKRGQGRSESEASKAAEKVADELEAAERKRARVAPSNQHKGQGRPNRKKR